MLDIKMMNPVDEQRPLAQLVVILLMFGAAYSTFVHVGPLPAALLALLLAFVMPASIAVLGLEGNVLKAVNPVAWASMIKGLGPLYFLVLALILLGYAVVFVTTRIHLWSSLEIALTMFWMLSVFSVLGGAIYERREQLGIETWTSPEQEAEKRRREDHAQNEKIIHEAYGQMRAGQHVKCWETLQRWLSEHDHAIDAYPWLCESVASWDDARYLTRLTEDHIEHLLARKQTGAALDLVSRRLSLDPTFRPKTAASTLYIAQLAARGGGAPKVARALISDFATRFPADPRTRIATSLAQNLET